MLREDPAHVDVMVLDSPEFPQDDPVNTDVEGTKEAIAAIFRDCEEQARCANAYPRLQQTLQRATKELDDHPVTVSTRTASGNRFDVRVDGSALLRALRMLLRSQTDELDASEPAAVYAALHGDVASIIAPYLAYAPAFCAGYLPSCDEAHAVSEGTYLSVYDMSGVHVLGRSRSPGGWFHRRCRVREHVREEPVDRSLRSLDRSLARTASVARAVSSDVPTLILLGRCDPYTSAGAVRHAGETLTSSWVVVNPNGGHNALSQSCMIQIRNAWVGDPTSPPDPECLPSIPPKPFVIDRS